MRELTQFEIEMVSGGDSTESILVTANAISGFSNMAIGTILEFSGIGGGASAAFAKGMQQLESHLGVAPIAQTDPNEIVVTASPAPTVHFPNGYDVQYYNDGIDVIHKDGVSLGNFVQADPAHAQLVIKDNGNTYTIGGGAKGVDIHTTYTGNSSVTQGFNHTNQP